MRVHWLQHAEEDGPGTLIDALQALGLPHRGTRVHAGEALPALADFDLLIPLGGPMNIHAHDAHPWLVAEKALLRAAIANGKRLFGICLGAQLLADALGGTVSRNAERERGWWPVSKTDAGGTAPLLAALPQTFTAFHWHEDTYSLPPGARCLARSAACAQQAFDYDGGRVAGVQFHPEITAASIAGWFEGPQWPETSFVQPVAQTLADGAAFRIAPAIMAGLMTAQLASAA